MGVQGKWRLGHRPRTVTERTGRSSQSSIVMSRVRGMAGMPWGPPRSAPSAPSSPRRRGRLYGGAERGLRGEEHIKRHRSSLGQRWWKVRGRPSDRREKRHGQSHPLASPTSLRAESIQGRCRPRRAHRLARRRRRVKRSLSTKSRARGRPSALCACCHQSRATRTVGHCALLRIRRMRAASTCPASRP